MRLIAAPALIFLYVAVAACWQQSRLAAACLVTCLLVLGLGGLVLRQAPGRPLNRAFFLLSLAFGAYVAVVCLLHLAVAVGIDKVETAVWLLRNGNLLAPAALMYFTHHFTGGRSRTTKWLWLLAAASVAPFPVLNLLGLHVSEYEHRPGSPTYVPVPTLSYKLCFPMVIVWLLISFAAVLAKCRTAGEAERRRYAIFLFGITFAAVPTLLGFTPAFFGPWFPSFFGISAAFFPLVLAFGVIRFELFDIKIVVRRTMPYALGTILIGACYAACLAGLEAVGASLDVLPRGTGWVVLLVLVGLAFQPVLEALQKGLDLLFFRTEADIDRFLAQAGPRYLAAGSPGELARMAAGDARQVLKLEGAAVLLGQGRVAAVAADGATAGLREAVGMPMPAVTACGEPVCADEEGRLSLGDGDARLAGALAAGGVRLAVPFGEGPGAGLLACRQKLSHQGFTPRDRMFLAALAAQAGTALSRLLARQDAESAHRLTAAVFESMTNAVALVARDGRVAGCNPAFERAFGVSEGGAAPSQILEELIRAADAGASRELETPHGIFLANARRLEGREGLTLAVLTDVSELRRLQEADRKRAALAEIGATVSAINHEIGNILAPLGYQLKKLGQAGRMEEAVEPLQVVRDRISALERLGRELREFYKEPRLTLRRVRVGDVVESTMADLRAAAGAGWVSPETSGLEAEVSADIQKLKQVLLNLAKNAWEAMQESGRRRWSVTAASEGRKVVIVIRDSGSGIPPDCLKRLFQPFFTTKKERGTGLGLATARRIVEAHGAEIEVESVQGEGTAFTLRWPTA
ncbi:MAG TPA: ATP-binding protein [Planctomycetota bacterium]|nr:ATP-binding protein [Planctomycetota bacterium]